MTELYGVEYRRIDSIPSFGAVMGHERHVCECGMTLRSCRCPGPHNITIYECVHGRTPIMGPNTQPTSSHEATQTEDTDAIDAEFAVETLLGVVKPGKPMRPGDQQLPQANDLPSMHDKATEDMQSRKELGASRYGVALQPCNGRDAVRDAYEEALDGSAYLAQAVWEQEHPEATWVGRVINALDAQVLMPANKRLPIFVPSTMFIPPAVVSLLENRGFSIERTTEE